MLRGVVLAALMALSGASPRTPPPAIGSGEIAWDEIAWPFPRDAWPVGKAYRCRGCDAEVYIRPKIGFCNCSTGVTDDAEVDAVSDIDMISADFVAQSPGEPVEAAGLRGRTRVYKLDGSGRIAAGFALSSKCDLLVAAAVGHDVSERSRIVQLLGSAPVSAWIATSLGLSRRSPQ